MRKRAVTLLVLAACGGKSGNTKDDGSITGTEPPAIDAATLPSCTPVSGTNVSVRRIAYGCGEAGHPAPPKCMEDAVLLVTSPPNDGRLFAVLRTGQIRIIENEVVADTAFLDLDADVPLARLLSGDEAGLLGLAFHPSYATNGKFYIDYTGRDANGQLFDIVEEFTGGLTDPGRADPASGKVMVAIQDSASNHNAGMIEFGSDGLLYISTGDGGEQGDPNNRAQNPNILLGKFLRIDVDHPANGKPYGIPTDNPYASGANGAPEVFMIGFRNPWRWSFDRANGDMWIGDVGQNQIEEVDYVPAGQQAGANMGWRFYEGSRCCSDATSDHCNQAQPAPCDPTGKTMPVDQRFHTDGWDAVIGGQVYRGSCYPDIVGKYFYSDNNFGHMATATMTGGTFARTDLPGTFPTGPASIHADARGELYEGTVAGGVWHIEAGP
jgi:glucose/arabinose dehydrogenase